MNPIMRWAQLHLIKHTKLSQQCSILKFEKQILLDTKDFHFLFTSNSCVRISRSDVGFSRSSLESWIQLLTRLSPLSTPSLSDNSWWTRVFAVLAFCSKLQETRIVQISIQSILLVQANYQHCSVQAINWKQNYTDIKLFSNQSLFTICTSYKYIG